MYVMEHTHTLHIHQKKIILKTQTFWFLNMFVSLIAFYMQSNTVVGTDVWNMVPFLCQVFLCGEFKKKYWARLRTASWPLNRELPVGQLSWQCCSRGLSCMRSDCIDHLETSVVNLCLFHQHTGYLFCSHLSGLDFWEMWKCTSLVPLCHVLRFGSKEDHPSLTQYFQVRARASPWWFSS